MGMACHKYEALHDLLWDLKVNSLRTHSRTWRHIWPWPTAFRGQNIRSAGILMRQSSQFRISSGLNMLDEIFISFRDTPVVWFGHR